MAISTSLALSPCSTLRWTAFAGEICCRRVMELGVALVRYFRSLTSQQYACIRGRTRVRARGSRDPRAELQDKAYSFAPHT